MKEYIKLQIEYKKEIIRVIKKGCNFLIPLTK